jgi:hypothetical protein
MNDRPIKRHLLAQGLVAQVEYCEDCDVFHLNVESLTVRFRPTALRDLCDTLSTALASHDCLLRAREARASNPRPRQEVH